MKGKSGLGLKVSTCTLWAPACTTQLFRDAYLPGITSGQIERFAIFTLSDKAEQDDDCAKIYHKSLLYLVSNAFEEKARIPLFRDGVPILGMEKFITADPVISKLLKRSNAQWVISPNTEPMGSPRASRSTSHGGFDDDKATLAALLARITGSKLSGAKAPGIRESEQLLRRIRIGIDQSAGALTPVPK